ncbi:MAG: FCD domain-containing protein, partial [Thermodesulfobacteriota bacterium]
GAEFSRRVVEEHDRILQALRNRDSEAAAQAMYEHVDAVEHAMRHIRSEPSSSERS